QPRQLRMGQVEGNTDCDGALGNAPVGRQMKDWLDAGDPDAMQFLGELCQDRLQRRPLDGQSQLLDGDAGPVLFGGSSKGLGRHGPSRAFGPDGVSRRIEVQVGCREARYFAQGSSIRSGTSHFTVLLARWSAKVKRRRNRPDRQNPGRLSLKAWMPPRA